MTNDMLRTVLDTANAKESNGWQVLSDGRLMSLYVAHAGVALTVQKIEAVRLSHGTLHARSSKGEQFMLALEDVFAAAFDAGATSPATRKAGFLG
jgi:hypothetical protein